MRNRIILFIILFCSALFPAYAGGTAELFLKMQQKLRECEAVEIEYSFRMTDLNGNFCEPQYGNFCGQDDCYVLFSDTFEMWCDGKSIWFYNKESDELSITDANPSDISLTDNPYRYITDMNISDYTYKKSSETVELDGLTLNAITLIPKSSSEFGSISFRLLDDFYPVQIVCNAKSNGSAMELNIKKFIVTPKYDISIFRPNDSLLCSDSVMVIDLR